MIEAIAIQTLWILLTAIASCATVLVVTLAIGSAFLYVKRLIRDVKMGKF